MQNPPPSYKDHPFRALTKVNGKVKNLQNLFFGLVVLLSGGGVAIYNNSPGAYLGWGEIPGLASSTEGDVHGFPGSITFIPTRLVLGLSNNQRKN